MATSEIKARSIDEYHSTWVDNTEWWPETSIEVCDIAHHHWFIDSKADENLNNDELLAFGAGPFECWISSY